MPKSGQCLRIPVCRGKGVTMDAHHGHVGSEPVAEINKLRFFIRFWLAAHRRRKGFQESGLGLREVKGPKRVSQRDRACFGAFVNPMSFRAVMCSRMMDRPRRISTTRGVNNVGGATNHIAHQNRSTAGQRLVTASPQVHQNPKAGQTDRRDGTPLAFGFDSGMGAPKRPGSLSQEPEPLHRVPPLPTITRTRRRSGDA